MCHTISPPCLNSLSPCDIILPHISSNEKRSVLNNCKFEMNLKYWSQTTCTYPFCEIQMLTTLRILVDNFLCETSELYVLGKQTKHIYGMGKVRNV